MIELTDFDRGYIAGIIDGEGSVCIIANHANEYKSPVVEVSSTTKEILDYLVAKTEGKITSRKKYAEHHKDCWIWSLKGDKAIALLTEIYPFLLVPEKKYRAKLIVNEYKAVTSRNGRYNEERLQKKLDFEKRFFEFNPDY